VLIGRPAKHHAIDLLKVALRLVQADDPAIQNDDEVRVRLLEPVNAVVVERRHGAIFLRAEALQPGLTRMDDKDAAPGGGNGADEARKVFLAVLLVDADPAFDRNGDAAADGLIHRLPALPNEVRLGHKAGAETTLLHAVGGAAAVQIDFVIAEARADFGRPSQIRRIAAAELQGNG